MGARRKMFLLMVFAILCSVLFVETAIDIEKKKVVLRSLTQCRGYPKMPMIWSGLVSRVNETTGETVVSLDVRLKSEVSEDLSIVFNFWRCDASGNPDSCEVFLKDFNATGICTYIQMKDQLWSVFIDAFEKPLICPLKPGLYKLRNLVINSDILRFLPVSDAVWKIEMIGTDRGKLVSCVNTVVQVLPIYVKKRQ